MPFRRDLIEDIVAHGIATVITLGFFAVIMVSLLGYVDLKDAMTTSLLGLVVGYVAGSLNVVLSRYFKPSAPDAPHASMMGKPRPPGSRPPMD